MINLKFLKKAWAVAAAAAMLSGCGFQNIKSDKDVLTSKNTSSTTALQVIDVPDTTTTPTVSDEPAISTDEIQPSPFPMTMVATTNVNARRGPSTADEIAQTVVEGTEVTAIGLTDDGWYQVEINGEQLYIIQDYLEEVEETVTEE